MNTFSFIRIDDRSEWVAVVLRRPPLNVMNIAMMKEMNTGLAALHAHTTAKMLVLKAEGKAFSAGVDVADHTPEKVHEMMAEFRRTFELLIGFQIPTLAVVDGAALGGGCELAIACDMVIASERAKFGQPEIMVGVFPPIAAAVFPLLLGRNRACELLLSGETITAAEAERIGLVNKVFPVESFEDATAEFITKFTRHSKVVLELAKRALNDGLSRGVMDAVHLSEHLYLENLMKTEDAVEGLKAFLEKRQPVWKNR